MAEVALAAYRLKLTLREANVWVLRLLSLPEHVFSLEGSNPGLPFDQIYDPSTVPDGLLAQDVCPGPS